MGAVCECCADDEAQTTQKFDPGRGGADIVDPNDEGRPGMDIKSGRLPQGRSNVSEPVLARPVPVSTEAKRNLVTSKDDGAGEACVVDGQAMAKAAQMNQSVPVASLKNLEAIEGLWREGADGSVVGKIFKGFVFWDDDAFGHEPTRLEVRQAPDGIKMELLGGVHSAQLADENGQPMNWQDVRQQYELNNGPAVLRLRWTDGETWVREQKGTIVGVPEQ